VAQDGSVADSFEDSNELNNELTPWSRVLKKIVVFSATQEIPHILWNLKVHYRIYKSPPPVPVLSQINPIHTLQNHALKIHFNIVFPTTPSFIQKFI
jgi:hypothetical protein